MLLSSNIICKQIAIEEGTFFHGNVNRDYGMEIIPIFFKEKRQEILKNNE